MQDEFYLFSKEMINTGPDAFFARIGRTAFVDTLVLPTASVGLKMVRVGSPNLSMLIRHLLRHEKKGVRFPAVSDTRIAA